MEIILGKVGVYSNYNIIIIHVIVFVYNVVGVIINY